MPDWNEIVRSRLAAMESSEVVPELAAHLEETYEQVRSAGLSDSASIELALQEAGDWRVLKQEFVEADRRRI